jgi:uncharacterized membrane protein
MGRAALIFAILASATLNLLAQASAQAAPPSFESS